MEDLKNLYNGCVKNIVPTDLATSIAALPHGTIKRFCPITIAVVGASRRFLAQARTHQVGINFVSASLQYSDYSGKADFTVPYELLGDDNAHRKEFYLESCKKSMETYEGLVSLGVSNDTAGYAAPQGLRNILILQANHDSWAYFIRTRACHRNTDEMQYVALRIWDMLYNESKDGNCLFDTTGPDCCTGKCREGKMSCGKPMSNSPIDELQAKWPILEL
jgi:thymidylate synthase (FAD)